MSRIVVTGANGFVGRAVCRLALAAGHDVTGLVRRRDGCIPGVREWVHDAPDFDGLGDTWPDDLAVDGVIHLAARVHVMRDDQLRRQRTQCEGQRYVVRLSMARFVLTSGGATGVAAGRALT